MPSCFGHHEPGFRDETLTLHASRSAPTSGTTVGLMNCVAARLSGLLSSSLVIAVTTLGAAGCNDQSSSTSTAPSASAAPSVTAPAVTSVAPSAPTASAPAASASASTETAANHAPTPVPDAITAQHVLVTYKGAKNAPAGVTRSKADAKKRAEEVVSKARTGADFTQLVAEYSDDASTKDRLGNLGKFTRDKMVKPFSDVAFTLNVGEVSGVVETPFGFHVIKRNQ